VSSRTTLARSIALLRTRAGFFGCRYKAIARVRYPAIRRSSKESIASPAVAGTTRILATALVADPVKAAFDMSMLIRWMDFSDTSVLGAHPSDNIGAILAAAQRRSERRLLEGGDARTMDDVTRALRTAYEIQGCLASNNVDGTDIGLDHVFYVKIASTAVAAMHLSRRTNPSHAVIHFDRMSVLRSVRLLESCR